MRALTLTLAVLAVSIPAAASAHQLRLLDATLAFASDWGRDPLDAPSTKSPRHHREGNPLLSEREAPARWTAGLTILGFIAAEAGLALSLGAGILVLESLDHGAGALFSVAVTGMLAFCLPPGAVWLTALPFRVEPSFGAMALGDSIGLVASALLAISVGSLWPFAVLPATFTVLAAAISARPVIRPADAPSPKPEELPESPEFDDGEDDSTAALPPMHVVTATLPRIPRTFIIPVLSVRF